MEKDLWPQAKHLTKSMCRVNSTAALKFKAAIWSLELKPFLLRDIDYMPQDAAQLSVFIY